MGLHVRDITAGATISATRRQRGRLAHASGTMAEDAVLRHYLRQGAELLASRWRGGGAEIDLILRQGEDIVFIEVKKAATHAVAAERLGRAQMDRICLAAGCFCDAAGISPLTPMRFDAALVDGHGRVEIIPNAFGAF
jgi:putative endonuclease